MNRRPLTPQEFAHLDGQRLVEEIIYLGSAALLAGARIKRVRVTRRQWDSVSLPWGAKLARRLYGARIEVFDVTAPQP